MHKAYTRVSQCKSSRVSCCIGPRCYSVECGVSAISMCIYSQASPFEKPRRAKNRPHQNAQESYWRAKNRPPKMAQESY